MYCSYMAKKGIDLRKDLIVWMELYWGERCGDFEPDCCCCKAWKAFDVLFEGLDELILNQEK